MSRHGSIATFRHHHLSVSRHFAFISMAPHPSSLYPSVPLLYPLRVLISSGSCAFLILYGVVLAPVVAQRPDPRAHLTPDRIGVNCARPPRISRRWTASNADQQLPAAAHTRMGMINTSAHQIDNNSWYKNHRKQWTGVDVDVFIFIRSRIFAATRKIRQSQRGRVAERRGEDEERVNYGGNVELS